MMSARLAGSGSVEHHFGIARHRLGVADPLEELVEGPSAADVLQRIRIGKAGDGSDRTTDDAIERRADLHAAALFETMANPANLGEVLAFLGIGLGQQGRQRLVGRWRRRSGRGHRWRRGRRSRRSCRSGGRPLLHRRQRHRMVRQSVEIGDDVGALGRIRLARVGHFGIARHRLGIFDELEEPVEGPGAADVLERIRIGKTRDGSDRTTDDAIERRADLHTAALFETMANPANLGEVLAFLGICLGEQDRQRLGRRWRRCSGGGRG